MKFKTIKWKFCTIGGQLNEDWFDNDYNWLSFYNYGINTIFIR